MNATIKPVAGSQDATGSASPKIPTDMLRLVCQVEDTEENRLALKACFTAISEIQFPGAQGFSILKLEHVRPLTMLCLSPNAPAQPRREEDKQ